MVSLSGVGFRNGVKSGLVYGDDDDESCCCVRRIDGFMMSFCDGFLLLR